MPETVPECEEDGDDANVANRKSITVGGIGMLGDDIVILEDFQDPRSYFEATGENSLSVADLLPIGSHIEKLKEKREHRKEMKGKSSLFTRDNQSPIINNQ